MFLRKTWLQEMFLVLYIFFCAILFPGQLGQFVTVWKMHWKFVMPFFSNCELTCMKMFFLKECFFNIKTLLQKVVFAVPILLVFIQFKNVDDVGSGLAKQSSSISWALLYCKYQTVTDLRQIFAFFDAFETAKRSIFVNYCKYLPFVSG